MPDVSKDLILLLQYLVPGFLVAWICFGMTSLQKPSQFERVVQALIYALFVHVIVIVERAASLGIGKWRQFGDWSADSELFASLFTAIILGFCFSYLINSDRLHEKLRKLNLSTRSSHPSEWLTAFDSRKQFVVLHLKDERRLYGWPEIWPSDPSKGHILISSALWLLEAKPDDATKGLIYLGPSYMQKNEAADLVQDSQAPPSSQHILIDIIDVKWVEFMPNQENLNGN
ncbi:DUF6338 family protein [Undibacterium sp. SXout7W]|uniref:DUF6338 family protein n=1 Tax=Undibacterium sp. SXout7W TaxID=3413049 RepID=UPI003BF1EC19